MNRVKRTPLARPDVLLALTGAWLRSGPNVAALADLSARRLGSAPAVSDGVETFSWRDLHGEVERRAANLAANFGLEQGARVALLGRSTSRYLVWLLALARLGCDVHLLDPNLPLSGLDALVAAGGFELLVADRPVANPCGAFLPLDSANNTDGLPRLPRKRAGRLVMMTGGTSGQARAVPHRAGPLRFFRSFLAVMTRLGLEQCDSVMIATPLHHGFGLAAMLIALALGREIALVPEFDAGSAARRIANRRLGAVVLVPTMLQRLLQEPHDKLASIRVIASGGAALPPALACATQKALGPILHNLYGTSETGVCTHASPRDLLNDPGTIGRPLPGVRTAIRDANGRIVEKGQTGFLFVQTSLTRGRHWQRTGDFAFEGERRLLHVRGRDDEMIVSGGENVFPSDVEVVLAAHPAVAAVAVVGVSDPLYGQRLAAYVVPARSLTSDELMEWATPRLARYQRPARIVLLDALPITPLGKIDRISLTRV